MGSLEECLCWVVDDWDELLVNVEYDNVERDSMGIS